MVTLFKKPLHLDTFSLYYVFKISYSRKSATGFFVNFGNISVLFTAKHCVSNLREGENLGIRVKKEWIYVPVERIIFDPNGLDAAALVLQNIRICGGFTNWGVDHVILSQPAIYCGFPLEIEVYGASFLEGRPIPLIKSGIVSAIGDLGPRPLILIETYNNKGFSGGPVFVDENFNTFNDQSLKIVGLVCNFRPDRRISVDRKVRPGEYEPTSDYSIAPNSGFMTAVPIDDLANEIKKLI